MIPLSREKDLYLGGRVRCDLTKLQFGGYERNGRKERKKKTPPPKVKFFSLEKGIMGGEKPVRGPALKKKKSGVFLKLRLTS